MGIGNLEKFLILGKLQNVQTHYPSWGLETEKPPDQIPKGENSLPLMGIGNQRGAVVALAGS